MRVRTKRLIFGSFLIGVAVNVAMTLIIHDQHGAHILPSMFVGVLFGVATYFMGFALDPDIEKPNGT